MIYCQGKRVTVVGLWYAYQWALAQMDVRHVCASSHGGRECRPAWGRKSSKDFAVGDGLGGEAGEQAAILSPHGDEYVSLPGHPVISLFTGCGGMDIGTERAGFCTVLQHEWSPDACKTLIGNRPAFFRHAALIQGDIRETPTEMILEEAGLRVGQAEIVTGGPPCQGFTTANKHAQKGRYDARNDLVFEYLRVVRQAMPAYFFFENVPGFQRFNDGNYAADFLFEAYDSYYEIVYGLCDAVDYGVPQRRVRFLAMGTRRDIALIDGQLAGLPAARRFGARDLEILRGVDGQTLLADAQRALLRPPGIRYFPDRPVLVAPYPNHDDGRAKGYLDFYDRLEREEPDRLVRVPEAAATEPDAAEVLA